MHIPKRPPKGTKVSLFDKYNEEWYEHWEKTNRLLDITFGQWIDQKFRSGELSEESFEAKVPFFPPAKPLSSYKRVSQQYFKAVTSGYDTDVVHFGWFEVLADPIIIPGYEEFDLFAVREESATRAFENDVCELVDGYTGMTYSCYGSSRKELIKDFTEDGPGNEFMNHLISLQLRDYGPSPRYTMIKIKTIAC